MKKLFYVAAVFALLSALTTGCAPETVETPDDLNAPMLSYKAVTGKASTDTRAAEETTTTLQTKAIDAQTAIPVKVYAADGTLWRELGVYYRDGNWGYAATNNLNHPGFELTHYAIYPTTNVTGFAVTSVTDATGSFNYTVPDSYTGQEDLLADSSKSNRSTNDATATLNLRHLLSQVNVSIKGKGGAWITIRDIKFKNVKNRGTYSFASQNTGSWSAQGGSKDYNYAMAVDDANPGHVVTSYSTNSTDEVLFGNHKISNVAELHNHHSNSLMLLPQSFDNNESVIEFTYKIGNIEGANDIRTEQTLSKPLGDLFLGGWQPNARYRVVLDFSNSSDIVPLQYSVAVSDWETGSGSNWPLNN